MTSPTYTQADMEALREECAKVVERNRNESAELACGEPKGKSVQRERLDAMLSDITYGHVECTREGFPDWHPSKFVIFFCESHGCKAHDIVTRIEFERIQPAEGE